MTQPTHARVNHLGVVVERAIFSDTPPDLGTGDKWLRIVRAAKPSFNPLTQKIAEAITVDVNGGTETHGWDIVSIDLAAVKKAKIEALVNLYNLKVAAGRLHNTKTYQIRPEDRENFIAVAIQFARGKVNPHGGAWRDILNAAITLNDAEMAALIDSVFAYLRDLKKQISVHKDAIKALGTAAEVDTYDITAGWPANT